MRSEALAPPVVLCGDDEPSVLAALRRLRLLSCKRPANSP
jgi:hypothetical protein